MQSIRTTIRQGSAFLKKKRRKTPILSTRKHSNSSDVHRPSRLVGCAPPPPPPEPPTRTTFWKCRTLQPTPPTSPHCTLGFLRHTLFAKGLIHIHPLLQAWQLHVLPIENPEETHKNIRRDKPRYGTLTVGQKPKSSKPEKRQTENNKKQETPKDESRAQRSHPRRRNRRQNTQTLNSLHSAGNAYRHLREYVHVAPERDMQGTYVSGSLTQGACMHACRQAGRRSSSHACTHPNKTESRKNKYYPRLFYLRPRRVFTAPPVKKRLGRGERRALARACDTTLRHNLRQRSNCDEDVPRPHRKTHGTPTKTPSPFTLRRRAYVTDKSRH